MKRHSIVLFCLLFLVLGCDDSAPMDSGETGSENTGVIEEEIESDEGDGESTTDLCADTDCDDDNPCTEDSCDEVTGDCLNESLPDKACDDGNACSTDDICGDTGVCAGAGTLLCEDDEPCTDDLCDETAGCVFEAVADGETCDDGDSCTMVDACKGGLCAGTPKPCPDDDNQCTVASGCDEKTGDCLFLNVPDETLCEDGNPCTLNDQCEGGQCQTGPKKDCDDGDACTDQQCDLATGDCSYSYNEESCDDGNLCTQTDLCSGGECEGSPVDCDDNNPCTTDTCAEETGCVFTDNGDGCDDGDACTTEDTCAEGSCVGGAAPDCNDGNLCTDDSCDGLTGCLSTNNTAVCDDGDACTTGDVCAGGSCGGVDTSAEDCDDGNLCTDDACDSGTGCSHTANTVACDDGDACTTGDVCGDSACGGVDPLPCDDDNVCTDDTCEADKGCVFTANAAACDDGNACTVGDVCGETACISGGEALACDDGELCTNDSCNPVEGCVYTANDLACDDDNACTLGDTCGGGTCQSGLGALNCDDDNVCTDDSCSPGDGCLNLNQAVACEDGNPCTESDYCLGGVCTSGNNACGCEVDADCGAEEDGNLCNGTLFCDQSSFPYSCQVAPETVVVCDTSGDTACESNQCDGVTGTCAMTPINEQGSCEDGDLCTVTDKCAGGLCMAGSEKNCDDDNVCTNDSCDSSTGTCVNVANDVACDDGNACTAGDACLETACQGAPIACEDGDACTSTNCDPGTGCTYGGLTGAACDDENACTADDTCLSGTCGGTAVSCDDDNPCTDDSCDIQNGCLNVPNAVGCDDGDACTTTDTCIAASCTGGSAPVCDDGNVCTTDSCESDAGCLNVANSEACDDGDFCTVGDLCVQSVCTSGSDANCDDNNACTADSCEAATGCVNINVSAACDDGIACTVDSCDVVTGCVNTADDGFCASGELCVTDTCDVNAGCVSDITPDCCGNGIVESDEECSEVTNSSCEGVDPASFTYEYVVPPNFLNGDIQYDGANGALNDGVESYYGDDLAENYWEDLWAWWNSNVSGSVIVYPGSSINVTEVSVYVSHGIGGGVTAPGALTVYHRPSPAEPWVEVGSTVPAQQIGWASCAVNIPGVGGELRIDITSAGEHTIVSEIAIDGTCIPETSVECEEVGEECDDGNEGNNDGCSGTCETEESWASCQALLLEQPGTPDGQYLIDPDGSGAIAPALLYCDMTNGGWTLVGNYYDSADDDMPNTTNYVVSGWQQTGSGAWSTGANSVDKSSGSVASSAVSMAFVQALGASAGQENLKMCFVHETGYDTTCRSSYDDSLTLVSYATGNPKLTAYSDDELVYTFGRLGGLAGSGDTYDSSLYSWGYCIPRDAGNAGVFGFYNEGMCENTGFNWDGVWHGDGCGSSYRPYAQGTNELGGGASTASCAPAGSNPTPDATGFRLYIGPNNCGDGILDPGEPCDDSNLLNGDGCSVTCQVECENISCDDGNVCTTDTCGTTTGCVYTPNAITCDDGDECTTSDVCAEETCTGGPAPDCDDGNECTDDFCASPTGCSYGANSIACDDGDACTTIDTCIAASCAGGAAPVCDDGNVCTTDSCDSVLGCLNAANSEACDDGDFCTVDDLCVQSVCTSGSDANCDDNNACTADSCEAATGCVNINVSAACDDGIACTVDSCDVVTGCVNTADDGFCASGELCVTDTCDVNAGCVSSVTPNCCGNGFVDSGEECDEGVGNGGSGSLCGLTCEAICAPFEELVFEYTGDVQTVVVPSGAVSMQLSAWGAQGGAGGMTGGLGGYATGTIPVSSGETIFILVGGSGTTGSMVYNPDNSGIVPGGFNGGGNSGSLSGSGGGASDVRLSANTLEARVLVAGGGGGGCYSIVKGGDGGGLAGEAGEKFGDANAGGGGTQSAGGTGGWGCGQSGFAGSIGQGAGPVNSYGAGGGGGFYGGGSPGSGCTGGYAGGGGGSSLIPEGGVTLSGIREGNGEIRILFQSQPCCGNGQQEGDEECDDGNATNGDGCSSTCANESVPLTCLEMLQANPDSPDGTYLIDPDGEGGNLPFEAYCDMTSDGGGWTLVAMVHPADQYEGVNEEYIWFKDGNNPGPLSTNSPGVNQEPSSFGADAFLSYLSASANPAARFVFSNSNNTSETVTYFKEANPLAYAEWFANDDTPTLVCDDAKLTQDCALADPLAYFCDGCATVFHEMGMPSPSDDSFNCCFHMRMNDVGAGPNYNLSNQPYVSVFDDGDEQWESDGHGLHIWVRDSAICGDGVLDPGEQCDDGNKADNDGCSGACSNEASPLDCVDVLEQNPESPDGIYTIDPDGLGGTPEFDVYCDMTTEGGGWTLILAADPLTSTWGQCSTSWVEDGFDEPLNLPIGDFHSPSFQSLHVEELRLGNGSLAQGFTMEPNWNFSMKEAMENGVSYTHFSTDVKNVENKAGDFAGSLFSLGFSPAPAPVCHWAGINDPWGESRIGISGDNNYICTNWGPGEGSFPAHDDFLIGVGMHSAVQNACPKAGYSFNVSGASEVRYVAVRRVVSGCGNGEIEGSEQCDDGNLANGDGCSSTCQTETENITITVQTLAAGGYHTCALDSVGAIHCWGDISGMPVGSGYTYIASGAEHSCALDQDGYATCWGSNAKGQVNSPGSYKFSQISCGWFHTCGLEQGTGNIYCWGDPSRTQDTPGGGGYLSVSAGGNDTLAINSVGNVESWGTNSYDTSVLASQETGTFTEVAAGSNSACGVRSDGEVTCWGYLSSNLTLSNGTTSIDVSHHFNCGITANGQIECIGNEGDGCVVACKPLGEFSEVSSGGYHGATHGCARESGTSNIVCWGNDSYGQAVNQTLP